MFFLVTFILIGLLIYIVMNIIVSKTYQPNITSTTTNNSYHFNGLLQKSVLTENEMNFFNTLKTITDAYDLYIFPKMRIADIIKANDFADFNKIKSKHIDFTICSISAAPLLFIELDDHSHTYKKNRENDSKKDFIFSQIGIKILRIKTNDISKGLVYTENIIKSKLNLIDSI